MTRQFLIHAHTASDGLLTARTSNDLIMESLRQIVVPFVHVCYECETWYCCVDRKSALQHRSTPDFLMRTLECFSD